MSTLPRILVIDDQYGKASRGENRLRSYLCRPAGLRDVTGDVTPLAQRDDAVAEAMFFSGQVRRNGSVENDLVGTLEFVRRGWESYPRWALILLDLHFQTGSVGEDGEPAGRDADSAPNGYFGLQVLEALWNDPSLREIPVVLLSSMERSPVERRFADRGVFAFVDKNDLDRTLIQQLLDRYGLVEDHRVKDATRVRIVGHSLPLLQCLRKARQRAQQRNDNILVLGESGTGKELLARYIHEWSGRSGRCVVFHPQEVAENLVEDRLFGHKKGAFTDAKEDLPGAAEYADGGTLFIDEFGLIPSSVQGKLLRLLDKNGRETQRSGSLQRRSLDLQVVMATDKLDMLSHEGFHQALLFRADIGDPILLPPLRERRDEIPLLVDDFVRKFERKHHARERAVTAEAAELLLAYPWPGNVRELANVVEKAVSTYRDISFLTPQHVREAIGTGTTGAGAPRRGEYSTSPTTASVTEGLDGVIRQLESCGFDPHQPARWANRLAQLERAYAGLMMRYVKAALLNTRKSTPEKPEGELVPTAALSLMTGSPLASTKAYDEIIRLLPPKEVELDDPVLEETRGKALKSRRKKRSEEGSAP
jgi:DNA-binding NtrC family response regulator